MLSAPQQVLSNGAVIQFFDFTQVPAGSEAGSAPPAQTTAQQAQPAHAARGTPQPKTLVYEPCPAFTATLNTGASIPLIGLGAAPDRSVIPERHGTAVALE